VTVVLVFVLSWWPVAQAGVEPVLVVPVDPVQRGQLESSTPRQGPSGRTHSVLYKPISVSAWALS
jgi:hypothetical protein